MKSQQAFNSSNDILNHPPIEKLTIGFMSITWAVFFLSANNYSHFNWYPWLLSSRIILAILGVISILLIHKKAKAYHNLSSLYMTLSIIVQASHGVLEGKNSLDFHSYTGVLFILASLSYNGVFLNWLKRIFPIQFLALIIPIFLKDYDYWKSPSNIIDNFSLVISGLLIGITVAKLTSSRYEITKKYISAKEELIKKSSQLAHDMQSPIIALETFSVKDQNPIMNQILQRLKELNIKILELGKDNTIEAKESINIIIKRIVSEFSTLHSTVILKYSENEYIDVFIEKIEGERVFTNLIINSIESGATIIDIVVSFKTVTVSDNGKGFSKNVLSVVGKTKITEGKSQGSGLGLLQVSNAIKSAGGIISFKNNRGAEVKMCFN